MELLEDVFFEDGKTIIQVDSRRFEFCEEIQIPEVIVDIENTKRQIRLIVKDPDGFDGNWCDDASKLSGNPIKVLTDYGLHLADNENNRAYMADILSEVEKKAQKRYQHKSLGWFEHKGERCYLGAEVVGASINSKFYKAERLGSKGTFEQWQDGVKELIKDAPELHLAMAISASAAVFPLLKEQRLVDGSIVIALLGGSSKSKTTVSNFMMTAYADPALSQGNIHTLSATDSYVCGTLSRRCGWLVVYDETSIRTGDMTTLLYQLGLGEDRGRCNSSGDPKETQFWQTTCVLTGERNIISEQTNGNAGIKARILPIDFLWTKTPELSERISEFCGRCYGTAYIPLAEYLMQVPVEELVGDYKKYFRKLCEVIAPSNGVERRLVKTYAVLLLSAKIASEAWNLPLDGRAVKDLLLKIHEANLPVSHPADQLYESVKSQLVSKSSGIRDEEAKFDISTNAYAIKGKHRGNPVLWVECSVFETMLAKAKESNVDVGLEQLYKAGYLIKAYGRKRVSKDFNGVDVLCYCLALKPTVDRSDPEPPKPKKRYRRKNPVNYGETVKNNSKMEELLAPDIDDEIDEETAPSERENPDTGEVEYEENKEFIEETIEETYEE